MESRHEKRYKSPLYLTPKGAEAGEQTALKINSALDEIQAQLSEKERVLLYRALTRIANGLEDMEKESKQ